MYPGGWHTECLTWPAHSRRWPNDCLTRLITRQIFIYLSLAAMKLRILQLVPSYRTCYRVLCFSEFRTVSNTGSKFGASSFCVSVVSLTPCDGAFRGDRHPWSVGWGSAAHDCLSVRMWLWWIQFNNITFNPLHYLRHVWHTAFRKLNVLLRLRKINIIKPNFLVLFVIVNLCLRSSLICSTEYDRFHNILNTLRTGSFKLFKRPFPGFLTILTL